MNIQTVTHKKVSFIVTTNPKDLELKYLKNNFGFSQLHLDDYINKTQVPKLEDAKGYTLVVLDFPFFYQNGQSETTSLLGGLINIPKTHVPLSHLIPPADKKRRLFSSQVDFFIGRDFLVVLHDGVLLTISEVFTLCQKTLRKRTELMEKGPAYLFYHLVDQLVDSCFPVINEISSAIDKVDRELETTQSQKVVEDISTIRRDIVVFHTMIKPIIPLFRSLEEGKHDILNKTLSPFWGNVLDHLQKIWDRLEDNRELIEGISESNESLLSSRANRRIAVLTIFSAILLPLNLLASIYGMNVHLPFSDNISIFSFIVFVMLLTSGIMLFLFRARHWL